MENELNVGEVQPEGPETGGAYSSDRAELAHVLFMDVVSFSMLPMEEQRQVLHELQAIVHRAVQAHLGDPDGRLIRLPTGDGMALVFFGDPIVCVECALEISSELKKTRLKLRMGINTGPVYRVADVNANRNVAGAGINMAQRVMDAGDAGHILLSKSTAEILSNFKEWAGHVHDLGQHAVKHGVELQFYNFYTTELGNPALPARFRAEHAQALKRRRRRIVIISAAALLVVAIGIAALSQMYPVRRRQSVAVVGFRNITARKEADWVSTGLAEGLRAQLATTGKLRTISGQESAEMSKDLGLAELDSLGKKTLTQIKKRGADLVVVGSYTDLPDGRIHLNLEIQDTGAGETVDSLLADGTEGEITQLIAQVGERLRTRLGLGAISAEKERQLALSQPSPEAAPLYAEGLSKLRAYEPMQARSFLEKAVIIDSAFPFGHSALGEAWLLLGYDQKAKGEAKQAFDLSSNLSFEDHTSIEGRYRGIAGEWPAAIASYQQLYKYSQSQKLDYGLKLAEAQRSAGKGRDALDTLAQLRKLPNPEGADPRIDLEEAETSASLGDLKRGLEVATQATEAARKSGARLMESRSLIWSCVAYRRLGELDKGREACEQAQKIAADLQDKLGTARTVNNLANIANDQGDSDRAKQLFEQALALGREIGDQRDVSGALCNIGGVLAAQGQLPAAKERFDQALKIQRDIGFESEVPNTLMGLADVLHQQGDLPGAQSTYEQAISSAQSSGNEVALAGSQANLGIVLFERGDLAGAERNYREALALERKLGAKSDAASILDSLGDLLVAQGKLSDAQQSYQDALAIQQTMNEKGSSSISKLGLASISLEKGSAAQAEAGARDAAQEFRSEKDSSNETLARLVLVRALLAQKKLGDAQSQINPILASAANAPQNAIGFSILTTSARLRAAHGGASDQAAAIAALQKVAKEADQAGMPGLALDARLAIAETEASGGRGAAARGDLSKVQKEAEAKGFLLIAQKAVPK